MKNEILINEVKSELKKRLKKGWFEGWKDVSTYIFILEAIFMVLRRFESLEGLSNKKKESIVKDALIEIIEPYLPKITRIPIIGNFIKKKIYKNLEKIVKSIVKIISKVIK